MDKINIAIADDHPVFRRGLVLLMESIEGANVICGVSNGQELIDQLPKDEPVVVLMDLEMPIMDGAQTTVYLKQHFPLVKVIIISMHDEDHFVLHMMEKGANGYLLKESDIDEVERAIRTVVSEDYYYGQFLVRVMHNRLSKKSPYKRVPSMHIKPLVVEFSDRELEVLTLICEGMTTAEVADKVCLSHRTVDGHRLRIMDKTQTKNTAGLVAFAIRNGIC
jgi:two-component system, NarL family, response regulator DegU